MTEMEHMLGAVREVWSNGTDGMTLPQALDAAYVADWQRTRGPDLSAFPRAELMAARGDLEVVRDRCHVARVKMGLIDRVLAG